jgi:hypothetical protein
VLGLLPLLLFGVVVCSFILLQPRDTCFVAIVLVVGVKALATTYWKRPGKLLRFLVVDDWTWQPIQGAEVVLFPPAG